MEIYSWDQIPKEDVSPLLARQMIHTPDMTILRVTLKQGAIVPLHQHVHEQITMPAQGALRIELEGKEIILRAGEVLRIPSNAPHLVEALEDSVGIELFTPAREDWKK
jgi:quercetin dioxygenase-like cupin family protein